MRATLLLGGVIVLATILRVCYLGHLSFWADEAYSAWVAQRPWSEFPAALGSEANMPAYYLLLRFWLHLGHNEVAMRSLSVLFSVATIPVIYALTTRLFDARVGLFASLFVTLNAFHVEYAQEARSYSLVTFLVSVASLTFVACFERPSVRSWSAYVVTTALAVYSHVFGILVLAAHWTSLVLLRPREIPWRPVLASTALIGVLVSPVVAFALRPDREHLIWTSKPSPGDVPRLISKLWGSGGYLREDEKRALAPPEVARRLLLLAYFVLLALALTRAVHSWRVQRASVSVWRYGLIVSWAFIPILLAFGISQVDPIFLPRFLIVSLPPLAILSGLGLAALNRRWLVLLALAIVGGLASRELYSYYAHAVKDDWRGATRYVLSHAQPGDAVVLYASGQLMFDYYRDLLSAPGGGVAGISIFEYEIRTTDAILFASNRFSFRPLQGLLHRFHRIWLVRKDDGDLPTTPVGTVRLSALGDAVQRTIERNHVLVESAYFPSGVLRVWLYRAR